MISELHVWFAETHCFTGTLNDMATEAELISADEEFLQSRLLQVVPGRQVEDRRPQC